NAAGRRVVRGNGVLAPGGDGGAGLSPQSGGPIATSASRKARRVTTALHSGSLDLKRGAAARYYLSLTAGLSLAGTRSPVNGPTAGELLLESSFARALQPALAEMYRRPIEANLTEMAEQSRDEIARSVLAFYRQRPDTLEPARSALARYARRGFEMGGQMGLDALGLPGQFDLSDEHIEGVLASHQ